MRPPPALRGFACDMRWQIFVFLVMLNIFLAILNDAYIAVKFKFDSEELEEGPPPLTLRERFQRIRQIYRQRKLDKRIEALRKQQRQKELQEKRAQRRTDEARVRTLKGMGVDPAAQQEANKKSCGDGSVLLTTEEL